MSEQETETWLAWTDANPTHKVAFVVPLAGTFDIADAGAAALGVELDESVNVVRAG